jgi:hypothetical protein
MFWYFDAVLRKFRLKIFISTQCNINLAYRLGSAVTYKVAAPAKLTRYVLHWESVR